MNRSKGCMLTQQDKEISLRRRNEKRYVKLIYLGEAIAACRRVNCSTNRLAEPSDTVECGRAPSRLGHEYRSLDSTCGSGRTVRMPQTSPQVCGRETPRSTETRRTSPSTSRCLLYPVLDVRVAPQLRAT